jgi:SAM-dependent methyltransferase
MAVSVFARLLRAIENGRLPRLRRWLWFAVYEGLARFWRDPGQRFMNYGYLPPDTPASGGAALAPDQSAIALYRAVIADLPLAGARVLEVGCGRGGGAAHLAEGGAPAEIVGVDLSPATVARARMLNVGIPRLAFRVGDAESLPFPDGSFDIVVNVESSHCYARMDRFVAEAARVLRPGGWLAWADMRSPAMLAALDQDFAHPALALRAETDLTAGVVAALDATDGAKRGAIARLAVLRPLLREFAGLRGSLLHAALRKRAVLYLARRYRRV